MSDDDTDEEIYRITSSKTVYRRRSHSCSSRRVPKIVYQSSDLERRPSTTYFPVSKWAVDYNNRNYVRSKCIKNKGLHRRIRGRPLDWHVDYDNNYYTRSKVNPLKGYHRRVPEVKRKYTPDNDDLADATGWEFDCGPEYDQLEQDVSFIPEGRIVSRGCYRWYGTRRNEGDCDYSEEEYRENLLNEKLERELRYADEFLQADRQHLIDAKDQRYTRGGYRFYETMRNAYDMTPEDFEDPEWRRKHHCNGYRYLDLDMCGGSDEESSIERKKRGKPFRRTVLNKVFELKKREDSPHKKQYATRLSLVPGEGEKTIYHGVPDRYRFGGKKQESIKSAFKRPGRAGKSYEDYGEDYTVPDGPELKPQYAERVRKMAAGRRRQAPGEDYSSPDRVEEYAYDMKEMPGRYPVEKRTIGGDIKETFDTWRDNTGRSKSRGRSGEMYYFQEKSPKKSRSTNTYSHREIRDNERNEERQQRENRGRRKVEKKRSLVDRTYNKRHSYKDQSQRLSEPQRYGSSGSSRSRSANYDEFKAEMAGNEKKQKKMPPHVQKRMKAIHEKVKRKIQELDTTKPTEKSKLGHRYSTNSAELGAHRDHLQDHGLTHRSESEKYINKNGSETWVKEEEDVTEIHHKNPK